MAAIGPLPSMFEITLTDAERRAFHNIDRRAYDRFVFQLGLDSEKSKKIVAFWNWLETVGYKNFVHNSLRFEFRWLVGLVLESISCLCILDQESLSKSRRDHLPTMSIVCGKALYLKFVHGNKENAKTKITMFVRDVCDRYFSDTVPANNLNNRFRILEPAVQPQFNTSPQVNEDDNQQDLINEDGEEYLMEILMMVNEHRDDEQGQVKNPL